MRRGELGGGYSLGKCLEWVNWVMGVIVGLRFGVFYLEIRVLVCGLMVF